MVAMHISLGVTATVQMCDVVHGVIVLFTVL